MNWVRDSRREPRESMGLEYANHVVGHVLGLHHEHQRPDAPQKLKFDCRALFQYAQAESLVATMDAGDELAFTRDLSLDEKMDLVLVLSPSRCSETVLLTDP